MSMVVLGAIFVDIKGYPVGNYIPGGRNAGMVEYVHGGVSRNIAEDLGNLDLNPVFISLVDNTGMGAEVIGRLERHHVETRYIRKVPDGMGTWLAIFDNSNDVCASISRRPDLSPLMNTLKLNGEEIFSGADSVLLEIDMDRDIVGEVFYLCEKYGKKIYAAVSNIRIAMERRDLFRRIDCFVCNRQEAGLLFAEDLTGLDPESMAGRLAELLRSAQIPSMVVTLGEAGAVWANQDGLFGVCPALPMPVTDTTGAGDAFFSGVAAGLTYGKSLAEACSIGTRLASAVICSLDNTCPHFEPEEFGLIRSS